MVINSPSCRHFDSQGEIEAWGPWESCVLFCIISIYRRTNVPVLQEHDWPVKQQHRPGKPCSSSSSLYCCWRTPKGANTLPFDSSFSPPPCPLRVKNLHPINYFTPALYYTASIVCIPGCQEIPAVGYSVCCVKYMCVFRRN